MRNKPLTFHLGEQFPALTYPTNRDPGVPGEPDDSGKEEDDLDPLGDDTDSDDLRPATDAIEL